MHLRIGEDLHGVVRGGKVVLVPCHCRNDVPWTLSPEVKLPASAAILFEDLAIVNDT